MSTPLAVYIMPKPKLRGRNPPRELREELVHQHFQYLEKGMKNNSNQSDRCELANSLSVSEYTEEKVTKKRAQGMLL